VSIRRGGYPQISIVGVTVWILPNELGGETMAYGTSLKLLWQIMERLQGATCEYHNAEIIPDKRIVYLPQVRAAFLREWPGSPNIHTRKATYQRVFISVANAGDFSRVRMVPLKSFRVGPGETPAIVPANGRDYLLPYEELSPFVTFECVTCDGGRSTEDRR
jgi:hypothetical protein